MTLGLLFWIVYLIALLFAFWSHRAEVQGGNYGGFGSTVFFFVLVGLLGWAEFGFIVHR